MASSGVDPLVQADRRVAHWLGRQLLAVQARTSLPVHALCFWAAAVLYVLIWVLLSRHEGRPEWTWLLVGSGLGAIAAYVADNEPVVPLDDDGVALTHFGLDARFAMMRLLYAPLASVLILFAGYEIWFVALMLVEVALFLALEYLQCIRLIQPDHPLIKLRQAFAAELLRQVQGGASPMPEPGADTPPTPVPPVPPVPPVAPVDAPPDDPEGNP